MLASLSPTCRLRLAAEPVCSRATAARTALGRGISFYPSKPKLVTMLCKSASALSPFTESVLIWYS